MYISHKSNVLQQVHETEWQCRRNSKGLDKSEYWTWLATITTQDDDGHDVVTYPSEDFTIVECTDEDVQARLNQLGDYQADGVYNIKYYASKRDSEIVDVEAHTIAAHTDEDGNDVAEEDVATTYVQSHFVGQDDTKDARLLAEQWTRIRAERDRLLTASDWTQGGDSPCTAIDKLQWKTYREELRDIPKDQSSETTYEDITWPTKPF
jgi:hypothetical protein